MNNLTAEEIALIREIAGLNDTNNRELEKQWADQQLTNQPKIENPVPEPTMDNFALKSIENTDHNLDNLADRLNQQLGAKFNLNIKIDRL